MSQKNQKNLIMVGGVVTALLIGTVLLGGFVKNEPAVNETAPAVGACPSSGCGGCPAAKACGVEKSEVSNSTMACPADCTKPCCAEQSEAGCCGKPCPPDCTKPCCADTVSEGCCGQSKPSACCSEEAETAAQ